VFEFCASEMVIQSVCSDGTARMPTMGRSVARAAPHSRARRSQRTILCSLLQNTKHTTVKTPTPCESSASVADLHAHVTRRRPRFHLPGDNSITRRQNHSKGPTVVPPLPPRPATHKITIDCDTKTNHIHIDIHNRDSAVCLTERERETSFARPIHLQTRTPGAQAVDPPFAIRAEPSPFTLSSVQQSHGS
jgi:hypothetical protein